MCIVVKITICIYYLAFLHFIIFVAFHSDFSSVTSCTVFFSSFSQFYIAQNPVYLLLLFWLTQWDFPFYNYRLERGIEIELNLPTVVFLFRPSHDSTSTARINTSLFGSFLDDNFLATSLHMIVLI